MSLGFVYIASDCFKLDYCIEDSIRSVAPIADQISVCIGECQDGTTEKIYELAEELDPEFIISVDKWRFDRNFQETFRTKAVKQLDTDWVFAIDADEMLHENELPAIKGLSKSKNHLAYNFNVNHYFGLPHWIAKWPGWYQRHSRMFHQSVGLQYKDNGHCVCQKTDKEGKRDITQMGFRTPYTIHHYGHTRDSKVMGKKNARFRGWYSNDKDIGDGILPENVQHEHNIPENGHEKSRQHLLKVEDSRSHPSQAKRWFLDHPRYIKWNSEGHEENRTNEKFIKEFFGE